MAIGTNASATSGSSSGQPPAVDTSCDQFIARQLAKTRRRVKLVDLATHSMVLIGSVLAFSLAVVLLDHWLIELNTLTRLAALLFVVAGVGYYSVTILLPLTIRSIHPAYAARAIEQSAPALKNSLINYLMFRGESSRTATLIRRALGQRAALDLKQVNMDLAVDRSRLIHIGYVVVALMLVFVAYTVLSPKDVFQTMRRVAMPWSQLARPSRVRISDVQPGDRSLIYGRRATVSARVTGLDADEPVHLAFTTADEQTKDARIAMQKGDRPDRFVVELPPKSGGLLQSLEYHIEAGDARSGTYRLTVLPSPTMLVDRVEYVYPPYMNRVPRVVRNRGEIEGPEGTRVTIHTRANQPIQVATIDLNVELDGRVTSTRSMKAEDAAASVSFVLQLDPDRQAPQFANYRLAFTTREGMASADPLVYPIQVTPDYRPEIDVLTPEQDHVEVPRNGRQMVEIRALDPDYGLAEVRILGRVGQEQVLDELLFEEPEGVLGQVIEHFVLEPSLLGLQIGDELEFWAVARDNRTQIDGSPLGDGSPQGDGESTDESRAQTRHYYLTVVAPDPSAQTPKNQPQPGDPGSSDGSPRTSDPARPDSANPEESPNEQGDSARQPQSPDSGKPDNSADSDAGSQQRPDETMKQDSKNEESPDKSPDASSDQASGESTTSDSPQQEMSDDGQSSKSDAGSQATEDSNDPSSSSGASGDSSPSEKGTPAGGSPSGSENGNDPTSGGEGSSSAGPRSESDPSSHPGPLQEGSSGSGMSPSDSGSSGSRPTQPNGSPAEGNRPTAEDGSSGTERSSAGDRTAGDSDNRATNANERGTPSGSDEDGSASGDRTEPLHDGEVFERALKRLQSRQADSRTVDSTDQPSTQGDDQKNGDRKAGSQGVSNDDRAEGVPADSPPDRESGSRDGPSGNDDTTDESNGSGHDHPDATAGEPDEPAGGKTGSSDQHSEKSSDGRSMNDGSLDETGAAGSSTTGENSTGSDQTGAESPDRQPSQSEMSDGAAGQPDDGGPSDDSGQSGSKGDPDKGRSDKGMSEEGSSDEGSSDKGMLDKGMLDKGMLDKGMLDKGMSEKGSSEKGSSDGSEIHIQKGNEGDPDDGRHEGTESRSGGGGGAASTRSGETGPQDVAGADEANLEFARKATDMVLEHLKEQEENPDPELLKDLHWTPDQMRRFVERWEALKRASREQGPAAQADLDDALRSLGLGSSGPELRRSSKRDDSVHGMRDAGSVSRPPVEFLEQFNAYRKGAARRSRAQDSRSP